MNFIGVLFFAGVIFAASSDRLLSNDEVSRSNVNELFRDFIHGERQNFPCGWPDSGIDSVEPFYIEEFRILIASSSEFSAIDFHMTDGYMSELIHMWINDFDLNPNTFQVRLDLSFARLRIVGDHRTSANMINGIITIPISGNGRVNMDIHNIHVLGNAQLDTMAGGLLHLRDLDSFTRVGPVDATVTGFGPLDGIVSGIISSAAPGMVNDSQDVINEVLETVIAGKLNRFLNQHTYASLIDFMTERTLNPPPRRCF